MPLQYSTEKFIERARKKHGMRFDYSEAVYTKSNIPIVIICPTHGRFAQQPVTHLRGKGGCPSCKALVISSIKRTSQASFIEKAKVIHNDYYDYSLVSYSGGSTRVKIVCPEHGVFVQRPSAHLQGQRCKKCAGIGVVDQTEFIRIAKEIHGDRYDYSITTDFHSLPKKVTYLCAIHGPIKQVAANHLNGSGCPSCNGYNLSHDEFLRRAHIVHGTRYSYPATYVACRQKIEVICPTHGPFRIRPANHLVGQGCKTCSNSISRQENMWLDSIGVPQECRQTKIKINNKSYIVDALYSNTVYEYWGDMWHGNPKIFHAYDLNPVCKKTYGELYLKTQEKRAAILSSGYKLIEIWESEWLGKDKEKIKENEFPDRLS